MMDDGQRTTPGVWHKLPTGELKTFSSIFLAFSKAEIKTFKNCVIMTDEHKNSAFNYVLKLKCDDIHYFFQSYLNVTIIIIIIIIIIENLFIQSFTISLETVLHCSPVINYIEL